VTHALAEIGRSHGYARLPITPRLCREVPDALASTLRATGQVVPAARHLALCRTFDGAQSPHRGLAAIHAPPARQRAIEWAPEQLRAEHTTIPHPEPRACTRDVARGGFGAQLVIVDRGAR
jgi:hypothetical protein